MEKLLVENQEKLRIKANGKLKQMCEEQKIIEEYAKMLDRQEQQRVGALKAREEKIKSLMGSMAEGVVKQNKEKELDEERRIQGA